MQRQPRAIRYTVRRKRFLIDDSVELSSDTGVGSRDLFGSAGAFVCPRAHRRAWGQPDVGPRHRRRSRLPGRATTAPRRTRVRIHDGECGHLWRYLSRRRPPPRGRARRRRSGAHRRAGANDGLRGVPIAQLEANLGHIIETAQARGISVLLCGMEALPIHGWYYSVAFHNAYRELAGKYQVPLVPFMLLNVIGNPEMMQPDRAHPNAA